MSQTHHADCSTLGLARVGGAHDFGRRARRLSTRAASTIHPKMRRGRRALAPRAARPAFHFSSTSCSWRCSCASTAHSARGATAVGAAGAAGWRRARRLRSTGRACAPGRGSRRRSCGARRSRARSRGRVPFWPLLRRLRCWRSWCRASSRAPGLASIPLERVSIGLQTMCSSHAGARALLPNAGLENRDLDTYEG